LIVSEGRKTEPLYFTEIRAAFKLHSANVEVRPSEFGTEPISVVQYAHQLFMQGDRHKRIAARAFEQVYAVFDRMAPAHPHSRPWQILRASCPLTFRWTHGYFAPSQGGTFSPAILSRI
jgi:hypothetical protein